MGPNGVDPYAPPPQTQAGGVMGPRRFGREYSSDPFSPVSGDVLGPVAPEVYSPTPPGYTYGPQDAARMANQPPPLIGFASLFNRLYGHMTPEIKDVALNLQDVLDALYSTGNNQWHPSASQYPFEQFVHDVAVAAAASGHGIQRSESRELNSRQQGEAIGPTVTQSNMKGQPSRARPSESAPLRAGQKG